MSEVQEQVGAGSQRGGGADQVVVHVRSLKTNERTTFKVLETATLDQVWNTAVDAEHLDEQRQADDTLRCQDGTDLTGQLQKTLAELRAEGVCPSRHFEIRGPSGGA